MRAKRTVLFCFIVLLICLMLSACQKPIRILSETDAKDAVKQDSEKTSYQEKIIFGSDTHFGNLFEYNGEVVALVNWIFSTLSTGEDLCEIPMGVLEQYDLGRYDTRYVLDNTGVIWMLDYSIEDGVSVLKWSKENEIQRINLSGWEGLMIEGRDPFIRKLRVSDGYIYVLNQADSFHSKLQIFDMEGELYMEIENIIDFDVFGSSLFTASSSGSFLRKYDVLSKQILIERQLGNGDDYRIFCISFEKNEAKLYVMMNQNLYTVDGDSLEQDEILMSRAENMIKCDSEYIEFMEVGTKGEIYCVSSDALFLYTPQEGKEIDIPFTLTITAPYKEEFVSQVIALYEEEYPEQRVDYDYAYTSRAEFFANAKRDNYFEQENLRLLSGDVGDIVMSSDIFPYFYDRLNSELFVNLNNYLEKDRVLEELDRIALNAITVEDQLKTIPIASDYYFVYINTALAEKLGISLDWERATWSDVFALYEKVENTEYTLFSSINPQRLLARILISNMPDIIDDTKNEFNLETEWFKELLEELCMLWNQNNFIKSIPVSPSIGLDENTLICLDGFTQDVFLEDQLYHYKEYNMSSEQCLMICPMFRGEKNTNRTAGSDYFLSISTWSENKDSAWQFISFILNKEVMNRKALRDMPINLKAREDRYSEIKEIDVEFECLQSFIDQMEIVYDSVDYLYDYGELKETLLVNIGEYLKGDTALEKALKKSGEAIWIHLNE